MPVSADIVLNAVVASFLAVSTGPPGPCIVPPVTIPGKKPVIAVDGCEKACARLATEKYSGEVEAYLDVSNLLKQWGVADKLSRSHPGKLEEDLTERVAGEIVKVIDRLIEEGKVEVGRDD